MKKIKSIMIITFLLMLIAPSKSAYSQGIRYPKNDTIRYIVKNEMTRFFGGTFWTGVEIPVKNKKSVYFSGIITYGSGLSSNKEFIGGGAEFQYRSYLGKGSFSTNYPIYLATQLLFRRINEYQMYDYYFYNPYGQTTSQTVEIKTGYNIFYGGLLLGFQPFINQIFTVDANIGGGDTSYTN